MQSSSAVKFIRRGGKVIPINAARTAQNSVGVVKLTGAVATTAIKNPKSYKVKPNKALRAAGFGLSVASGALGAATFSGSGKVFATGLVAGIGLDVASSAVNIAAHAGKGHSKERAIAITKQEGINQAAGWGIYGAGVLASSKNRASAVGGIKSVASGAKTFGLRSINLLRRVI